MLVGGLSGLFVTAARVSHHFSAVIKLMAGALESVVGDGR